MNLDSFIEEFRINNYNNFTPFYNETSRQIYFTAYSVLHDSDLAEDIMQDTYLAFLNNIDSFKKGTNVYAYLTTIARNKSINIYNKNKREIVSDEYLSYIPDDKVSYDSSSIDYILDLIPDQIDKDIIVYHVILDYKFKDIANILLKPLGTILWRYNKAIKKLREEMSNNEE